MAPPGRQVPDPAPRGAQGATGPLSMSLSDKRFAFVTEQKHRLPPFELGAGGPPACCPASLLSRETQRTMLLSCVASPSVPLQAGVSSSPPRVPANRCLPPPPSERRRQHRLPGVRDRPGRAVQPRQHRGDHPGGIQGTVGPSASTGLRLVNKCRR